MNTRRQGSLGAILETGTRVVTFMLEGFGSSRAQQLKYGPALLFKGIPRHICFGFFLVPLLNVAQLYNLLPLPCLSATEQREDITV